MTLGRISYLILSRLISGRELDGEIHWLLSLVGRPRMVSYLILAELNAPLEKSPRILRAMQYLSRSLVY